MPGRVFPSSNSSEAPPPGIWGGGLLAEEYVTPLWDLIWGREIEVANTPAVHPDTGRIFIIEKPVDLVDADGNVIKTPTPNADSGVFLRGVGKSQVNIWCWPCGSGEIWGYRNDKSMPAEVRAGCVPWRTGECREAPP